ncbi:hypothetical protein MATL_G00195480, partial [Megalops atlanticus]
TTITNDGDTPYDITGTQSISSTGIQLSQTSLPTELSDTSGTTPQPGTISIISPTTTLVTDTQTTMTTAETVSMTDTSHFQSDKTTMPTNTDASTESSNNTIETTNEATVNSNVENYTTILPTTLTATTQQTTWTTDMVTTVTSSIASEGFSSNTNTMAATTTVVSHSNTTPLDTGMNIDSKPLTTTLHTTNTAAATMTEVHTTTTTITNDGDTPSNITGTQSISSTGIQLRQTSLPTELPHTSITTPQPGTISILSPTATTDTDTQSNMTTAETVSMTDTSDFQSDKTTIPSIMNTSTQSNISTVQTTINATVTSNVESFTTILPTTLNATAQPTTWTTDTVTSLTDNIATEGPSFNANNTMAETTTVVSHSNTTPLDTGMTTDTEPIATTLHATRTEVEAMTTTIINNGVTYSNITGTQSISSTGIQPSKTTLPTELPHTSITAAQPGTISVISPTATHVTDTQFNMTAETASLTVTSGFQTDKTTILSNINTSTQSKINTVQTTNNSTVTSNVERYTTASPTTLTATTQPTTWTTDTVTSDTSGIATRGSLSNTNNTMATTTGVVSNSNSNPLHTSVNARETSSIATIAPNIPSNTSLDPTSMTPTAKSNTNTTLTVNFSISTASTLMNTTAIPTRMVTFTQPNVKTTHTANQGITASNAESGTTTGFGHPTNSTSVSSGPSISPAFSNATPFVTSAIPPKSISTTTIPTTMSPPSESVVLLEIYLDLKFEEDLKNSSSEKFKTLAKNLTQQLDMIYKKKYGDSFSHSEVKGFRKGSVVVIVSLVFSNFNAVRNISDVIQTLEDAVTSSEFSFPGKIEKIKPSFPTKPPPTKTIIPTTLSAKTTPITSQSQHTTAVPMISVATALTMNSDTQTTNPSSTSLKTSAATSVQPIRRTAHPMNTAPYSTNIKPDTSAPFSGSTAFTHPNANATEAVQTVVTSHSQSDNITAPTNATPFTKSDMTITQTTSIAAVTLNIENITAAYPTTLTTTTKQITWTTDTVTSATSSIATRGSLSNTNNTMATTTGVVSDSNSTPLHTSVNARETSSIATIAPEIPSNTSLDPTVMTPTAKSNTITTLTVNFAISTASTLMNTTAIPTRMVTITQPNVKTTHTANQGNTASNAESGTTTGFGHPTNSTSVSLGPSISPAFSNATPFVTSAIPPKSISTTTIPTTMSPPSESVVLLEIHLDLKFEEDLKNSSSEKFKTLAKNLTQQLDMIYKKKYGDSFSHSKVKGFRRGSVVVIVSLVFSNFNAVRNISDVIQTLEDAVTSSEFSFPGKIIEIIPLFPTRPPATTTIIPTTLSAKTNPVISQSQRTTNVTMFSMTTVLTMRSDTQTTNPSSSTATSVQPIRSTSHPMNTAPYSTNIKPDTSPPFAGSTAFTHSSANATEAVQTVTSHSQSGKITAPTTATAFTKSDMTITQTTSIAAVTSNIENITSAFPTTLTTTTQPTTWTTDTVTSATSSIATRGFSSNSKNTMATTTAVVSNSNTTPMDMGTSARKTSSIATIAPNIPSNTSLDPISVTPTVQSNTNTTLTVNFSINTAGIHLSTTAIPTSTITFTQPNVNTTHTANQGITASNAESGTTTGFGTTTTPTNDIAFTKSDMTTTLTTNISTVTSTIENITTALPTTLTTTTQPTTWTTYMVISTTGFTNTQTLTASKLKSTIAFTQPILNITQSSGTVIPEVNTKSFTPALHTTMAATKGYSSNIIMATTTIVSQNKTASLHTGTKPTTTTLRTTNSVRFTVTQINTTTTAMNNNTVTTPNITVTAVSSPGIPPNRTTLTTRPLHTSNTTPQPATTSVISPTTAVTTVNVKTVQLQFSLQKEFTAELSIPSSNEFKQLAKNITVEMDKIYSQKFPTSFVRSTVLGFRKGSVIADMHLLFKEKQSDNEVVSSSSVQTVLHTVVSQSTNNSFFSNIIPTSIQALEEMSVSVNLSLILPFSSSLNDSHSPEYIELSTKLNNWLGAVFSKFFGNVSRSSATQFRNIDGWVGAQIVFKFNVETRIADDVLTAAVLNSQSPFLYLKHLLSVNGFQAPADILLISMRITSLHFTEELTYRGSATFLLYSSVIRTSVIKLYKGKEGFIDVYVTRMMPGSVVVQLVIVFDKSRISTHDVTQVLLSGLPQLEFNGLTVDPSSMQIVSQPVTSPRPFPGYAVAIIVMCGLAIILLPVAVLIGV